MTEQQEILAKQNFHEEMLKFFKRTAKEVKYKPTRRLDMINKYGGYEAAIKVLPTDSNTFDFTLLWEQERLDLSIEALVTKERYRDLFPKEVIDFCQKRLDEYNYAPKKLAVEPDDMDAFLNNLFTDSNIEKKETKEEVILKPLNVHDSISTMINSEKWHELLLNQSIFTLSNRDLIIKIFALGERGVTIKDLGNLEGYSLTYPFYEVVLALCKRIKAILKLDTPKDNEGKAIWWHLLFTGEVEDKRHFTWFLRKELREAIYQLMIEGVIPKIEVPTFDTVETEEVVSKEIVSDEDTASTELVADEDTTPMKIVSGENPIPTKLVTDECTTTSEDTMPTEVVAAENPMPTKLVADEDVTPTEVVTQEATAKKAPSNHQTTLKNRLIQDNPKWQELKTQCIDYFGPVCELCGFDFGYTYGSAVDGFIHIHCIDEEKLHDLNTINPQEDLIPICCNCEAVIHHKNPPYTAHEIRKMLKENMK